MAAPARDAAVKKKHVRFARMEDEAELEKQEEEEEEEEEEDTLFDRRKDAGRGLRSALKAGRRSRKPGLDGVEVHGAWRGAACGRWMVTLALCASFLGLGMSISVLGPTFQDLAENVNKNISNISYIFVGRSVGYIGGSLLGGLLFDCMSPHLLLGLSMLVTALGMCAIPFCKKALLLTALMSSIGMSMGVLDTGGNVLILNTWGVQAGPHMQALHFSFAAGAFASPIIAKLLFTSDPAISPVTKPAAAPAATGNTMIRYVHGWSGSLQSMWAYVVIGGFVLLTSLLFFVLLSRGGRARERPHPAAAQPLAAKHHALLILLLCVFFFFYVGAEVAYGSFIFTFAKDYAHMEPAHAAGLNSLFWGAFAACRGLAIFFAACVSPGAMILLSLAGSTLSALLLCLFSRQKAALWACTGLYGASMATTFPSGISWVEQYTVVTGRSAALFVVGAALGEMVLPALLGFLLGRVQERPLLMYVALLTAVITSILFPLMYRLATVPAGHGGKPRGKPRPDGEDTEYRRALLDAGDEEDEENNEADQWNDADFEVIEMDDASSLAGSPGKASSPPDLGALTGPGGASPHAAPKRVEPSPGVVSFSDTAPLMADSPRRKKLLSLAREKRD